MEHKIFLLPGVASGGFRHTTCLSVWLLRFEEYSYSPQNEFKPLRTSLPEAVPRLREQVKGIGNHKAEDNMGENKGREVGPQLQEWRLRVYHKKEIPHHHRDDAVAQAQEQSPGSGKFAYTGVPGGQVHQGKENAYGIVRQVAHCSGAPRIRQATVRLCTG